MGFVLFNTKRQEVALEGERGACWGQGLCPEGCPGAELASLSTNLGEGLHLCQGLPCPHSHGSVLHPDVHSLQEGQYFSHLEATSSTLLSLNYWSCLG